MTIPDFQTLMLPVLEVLSDGKERPVREITAELSNRFRLTDEESAAMLPSGQARVIVNRVAWAKTYLDRAGLLKTIRRGIVVITDEGKSVLLEGPPRIDMGFLERFPSYLEFRQRGRGSDESSDTPISTTENSVGKTPDELIEDSAGVLRSALEADLLAQVLNYSDKFFERLVVELLVAMGYGGTIEDAGKAVGKSGDGGIDGVIKEDKLGLDVVVIQAKRWTNKQVGRPDVQSFAGSMEAYRANKGVFITSSNFSEPAREYVRQIQRRIVLIDGRTLAGLMIDHGIGVSTYRTITLKRIDTDYFDE